MKETRALSIVPSAHPLRNDVLRASAESPVSQVLVPIPRGITVLVWMICLSALINLVCSMLPTKPELVHWISPWAPFEISEGRQIRMFSMGILLLILASGLGRGKRTFWLMTMGTLAVAPLLHYGRGIIWPQALLNYSIIGFLLAHHRYFVVGSNPRSVRFALVICPLLLLVLVAVGTVRLHDYRDQTSGEDDWGACFQTACELVLVHHTVTQTADTTPSKDFFSLLRVAGTVVASLGLYLALWPALERRRSRIETRDKVRSLINLCGNDPFDPYALLADKSYFFSSDGRVVIPYVYTNRLAVALADPIGPPALQSRAIEEFLHFCLESDWEPVFYQASSELSPVYASAGLAVFKIGEEARVRTDDFPLRGNHFQNLRTARNRAHKRGLQFRLYHPGQLNEELEMQLEEISHVWLSRKKVKEMSFDMGSFSIEELRRDSVAVATDPSGKVLAFATWRAFAQGGGQTLDLMRVLPDERNIMDYVLVESILHFRSQGILDVCLGTAPLANTEEGTAPQTPEEKAVHFLYENLNKIYGYKSLFEFKRKYRPQWRGRYVAYRRGAHLPLVGLALVQVHSPGGLLKFFVR